MNILDAVIYDIGAAIALIKARLRAWRRSKK